jgi:hypothetical protein
MLAAILKQLVQSRLSTLGPVEELRKKHAGCGTKPLLDDIYSALRDVLAQYQYVHIVVDALGSVRAKHADSYAPSSLICKRERTCDCWLPHVLCRMLSTLFG